MQRVWFRVSGVVVIVLSISLPFLTTLRFSGQDAVVSLVALCIAAVSGLRGFFRWEEQWHLYRRQDLALTALLARWEINMIKALRSTGADNQQTAAEAATDEVLRDAQSIGLGELNEFFEGVAWPDNR